VTPGARTTRGTAPGAATARSAPALRGGPSRLESCTAFLYREAELLDTLQLDRWLELFDNPCVYWLPIDPSASSPLDTLNLVYDDRPRLQDRVARFRSGFSFSETPESRTSHLLGNLRMVDKGERDRLAAPGSFEDGDVTVAARAVVARLRRGVCDTFHARMAWVLRPDGASFAIRLKRVDLLESQEPLPLLTFLL
jgi:benzoate/toluate 1,2-dioxygenase beta subunit